MKGARLGLVVIAAAGLSACSFLDQPDQETAEAFYGVITNGNFRAVDQWIRKDPHLVNVRAANGVTPLMAAVLMERSEIVALLVANGGEVSMSVGGMTPLHIAAQKDNAEIARLLIEYGADVDGSIVGLTPLQIAARYGSIDVVKLLVEKGAQVNARYGGATPLAMAEQNHRYVVATFLRQHGGLE